MGYKYRSPRMHSFAASSNGAGAGTEKSIAEKQKEIDEKQEIIHANLDFNLVINDVFERMFHNLSSKTQKQINRGAKENNYHTLNEFWKEWFKERYDLKWYEKTTNPTAEIERIFREDFAEYCTRYSIINQAEKTIEDVSETLGKAAGNVAGGAIKGASKGLFGNMSTTTKIALAGGAVLVGIIVIKALSNPTVRSVATHGMVS